MSCKNRKRSYSEAYLKWGFTSITDQSIEKPQCVICGKVLAHESMKPSKLKDHLEKVHSEHTGKDIDFF